MQNYSRLYAGYTLTQNPFLWNDSACECLLVRGYDFDGFRQKWPETAVVMVRRRLHLFSFLVKVQQLEQLSVWSKWGLFCPVWPLPMRICGAVTICLVWSVGHWEEQECCFWKETFLLKWNMSIFSKSQRLKRNQYFQILRKEPFLFFFVDRVNRLLIFAMKYRLLEYFGSYLLNVSE